MKFYKVIVDGNIIDANYVFLKWQAKHHVLLGCDPSEAMFIQSSDQEKVWRTSWLLTPPEEAGDYPFIDAVEISAEEYAEIREKLDEGTEVPDPVEPEPEPDPDEPDQPDPPAEQVMSVAEMRQRILQLEDELTAAKILLGVE